MNIKQLYREIFGSKDPTILDLPHANILIKRIIDIDRKGGSDHSKFDIAEAIGAVIYWIDIPPDVALKSSTIKEILFWVHENWDKDEKFRGEAFDILTSLEDPRDILSFLEQKSVCPETYRGFFRYCDDNIFTLDEKAFFKDVELFFPELTTEIMSWENLTKYKLEVFSRYTQCAMDVGDFAKAEKCFNLVAHHFEKSGKNFRHFISISYLKKVSFRASGNFLVWEMLPKNLKAEFEKVVDEKNL